MSAPATRLELESPTIEAYRMDESEDTPNDILMQDEDAATARLRLVSPPDSTGPIIAVDMDDVLSATNHVVAQWHNKHYGSKMDVSNFYYYYYWKNPYWGTPAECFDKVRGFYHEEPSEIHSALPVPGAREGTQALKGLGYRLIVVTARTPDVADKSWEWISKYYPDIFESIICTGQFKNSMDNKKINHEVVTKLSKAEVCANLPALLLIDDSLENALSCSQATPKPTRCILFGDYQWNKRHCLAEDHTDDMSWDRRVQAEGSGDFLTRDAEATEREVAAVPHGQLQRVKDWGEVVSWVKSEKEAGRM